MSTLLNIAFYVTQQLTRTVNKNFFKNSQQINRKLIDNIKTSTPQQFLLQNR